MIATKINDEIELNIRVLCCHNSDSSQARKNKKEKEKKTVNMMLSCLIYALLAIPSLSFSFCQLRRESRSSIIMKDSSTASVYFSIGNKVRIVKDVFHTPHNMTSFSSLGMEGVICSVWDKCEVDPFCCCAELAYDAPIEVKFAGSRYDPSKESWNAHFALDELETYRDE